MEEKVIYDIIGIGIGPFNLGLAAILLDIPELHTLFLEECPGFNWHAGMLLPTARMQVPFYADLVTIVNPQSPFTYSSYLHKTKRFFRFANHNNNFPLRVEYNRYCQWVAAQLPNLRFNNECKTISFDRSTNLYCVYTDRQMFHAKHIVLGTGTSPVLPDCLQKITHQNIFHSAQYLFKKEEVLKQRRVTIIGSGQSAAEIFLDLLSSADQFESLAWFTRSERIQPMDYSAFTTEMTSLDYIDHFYSLTDQSKARIIQTQEYLYKGVNAALIAQINDMLYVRDINHPASNVFIQPNCSLTHAIANAGAGVQLDFTHTDTGEHLSHQTGALIAATGYGYTTPPCILPLLDRIQWTGKNNYKINRDYSIDKEHTLFVQNADLLTHGFNAADLGMGPYRNATILNSILQRERFTMERGTAFQSFNGPGKKPLD